MQRLGKIQILHPQKEAGKQTRNISKNLNKEHQGTSTKWNPKDEAMVARAIVAMADLQKVYGKVIDARAMLAGFKMVLEKKYTALQVTNAMAEYLERYSDMPTPADIANIISPKPRKISYQEYADAKARMKASGYYNKFSDEHDIIKEYEGQRSEDIHAAKEKQDLLLAQRPELKILNKQ